jgi:hypothetical protein
MRDATVDARRQHLDVDPDVALQLHALPVRGQLGVSALHRERGVVVRAVGREQSAEHRFVLRLPGGLVALNESGNVHRLAPSFGRSRAAARPRPPLTDRFWGENGSGAGPRRRLRHHRPRPPAPRTR